MKTLTTEACNSKVMTPKTLQYGIVLSLSVSERIPVIASLSAADGSLPACEPRPKEMGGYRVFCVE